MAETKKTPVVVDDVTYYLEDMTEQQQTIVSHLPTFNWSRLNLVVLIFLSKSAK